MRRLSLAAAFGLAACATASPPQPVSLDHGLLVARVEARGALIRRLVKPADAARIAALDAAGADIVGQGAVSGLAAGGYVVFFNVIPGRYALREASFPARGARYHLTSPAATEGRRIVVLGKGAAAYLGDHGFDSRWPERGAALKRAARIVGHWLTPFLRRPALPRDADLTVYDAGRAAESRALLAVRASLAKTQWRRVVDARLRELSAPEPAKVSGLLARALPLREEKFLSWRDTLGWGEPRRAPEGLAWRRGEVQVAIFFTTASAPGFSGWSGAVSELRRSAAASVEDSGGVYEVRVATRAGAAARATSYRYPSGKLVGSETAVLVTETTLVPDGYGLFTARLRAPRGEFDAAVPAYREFLLQLELGPPKPKPAPKPDTILPFAGTP